MHTIQEFNKKLQEILLGVQLEIINNLQPLCTFKKDSLSINLFTNYVGWSIYKDGQFIFDFESKDRDLYEPSTGHFSKLDSLTGQTITNIEAFSASKEDYSWVQDHPVMSVKIALTDGWVIDLPFELDDIQAAYEHNIGEAKHHLSNLDEEAPLVIHQIKDKGEEGIREYALQSLDNILFIYMEDQAFTISVDKMNEKNLPISYNFVYSNNFSFEPSLPIENKELAPVN